MIEALANTKITNFFTKRIVYTNVQIILNDNNFFQYSNVTDILLIKTLLNIYHFIDGDISNNELYSLFWKLDKQVSSTLKRVTDFTIESIKFNINFGIKNGRRIYKLEDKIFHLKHFFQKPRTRFKINDIIHMYKEDESTLQENRDMYEQIYDILDDTQSDSYLSADFWHELAAEMLPVPPDPPRPERRVQPRRACRRGGIRKANIKKTISKYKDYHHNDQLIKCYHSLLNKIKKL